MIKNIRYLIGRYFVYEISTLQIPNAGCTHIYIFLVLVREIKRIQPTHARNVKLHAEI